MAGRRASAPASWWILLLLAGAWTGLPCTRAFAVVLSGSTRTTLYTQRAHRTPDEPLEARSQMLETLRLDARQIGVPALSFHTAFTGSNIVNQQSARMTMFRLYRGYLQYASVAGRVRYDARLGRQWVLAGVGTGLVDGATLALSLRGIGALDGFFGTLGTDHIGSSTRFWTLDKPSESRAYGGRLRLRRVLGPIDPALAVSYAQTERTPHETLVTDTRRLGIDGELRLAPGHGPAILQKLRAWGDYRRDMIFSRSIDAAGGLDYTGGPRALRVWAEYDRRTPLFTSTDFFSSFDSEPANHVRGGASAIVYKPLLLSLDGDLVSFSGDEREKGARILLSACGVTAGWRVHGGYGGDLSGLILYGHRTLWDRLLLDAAVNLTEYKYDQIKEAGIDGIDQHESTGMLSAGYRLLPDLLLTGQVEAMRNAQFKHDVRFLGFIDYRFRTAF